MLVIASKRVVHRALSSELAHVQANRQRRGQRQALRVEIAQERLGPLHYSQGHRSTSAHKLAMTASRGSRA